MPALLSPGIGMTLRDRQSAELDAGFAAILNDFIGSYLDGCTSDTAGFYDSLIEAG